VLALRHIAKSFGDRRALADVSLEVNRGEAVLLVGANGAGKTTLLRIATGFLDADAGEATVDGFDIRRQRTRAQARLGYLPEHAPAPAELTVRDHLRTRARLKGLRDDAAVDKAMAAVSVTERAQQLIGTLSKGFRQRVGLADALLGDPPLLVLDEPTSGMDPVQTKELRSQLGEIAKERAVLVSSHAIVDLKDIATRIAVLREGSLLGFTTPDAIIEITQKPKLEDAIVELLEAPK